MADIPTKTSDLINDGSNGTSPYVEEIGLDEAIENNAFIGAVVSEPVDVAYVDTANIKDDAVNSQKIANSAITNPKIADGAISTTKLADNSITSGKIVDGTITAGDINLGTFGQQCAMATGQGSASVNFTPRTSGGYAIVMAVTTHVWGYAGGSVSLDFTGGGQGLSYTSILQGTITGGDTIGRQMTSVIRYGGFVKDTTYTFGATFNGALGVNANVSIIVMYFNGY